MYQTFFLFAFLAFTAGVPLNSGNWQSPFPSTQDKNFGQQRLSNVNLKQEDDSQIVDSLGGGYSFFKKQPIVARPVIQQQLAINDQQGPISSFADTSNQWSDYTKASAFKHQPKTHVIHANKDLIKDQGTYGSPATEDQTLPKNIDSSKGQLDLQQSWVPKSTGGYGQQEVRTFVPQQPLIRDDVKIVGQKELQKPWAPKSTGGYGQQEVRTFLPQQPLIRDDVKIVAEQELQKPWAPKSTGGYGQQEVRTFVPQQPLIRDDVKIVGEEDLQKPWAPKSTGGYGQQEVRTFVPQQPLIRDDVKIVGEQELQKPWAPKSTGGYGQQEVRTFLPQQPLIRDDVKIVAEQELQKPWAPKSTGEYGQQEVRTFVPQQPLIRDDVKIVGQKELQKPWAPKSTGGYGQRVEPSFGDLMSQKMSIPMVNSASSVQFAQPSWSAQQTGIPQGSSSMISSRTFSQSQPIVQKSNGGSFGPW